MATQPAPVVEQRISTTSGGDQVDISLPGRDPFRSRPLTVTLTPGGITHVGSELSSAPDRLSRASIGYPHITGDEPFRWASLLPYAFLAGLGWFIWNAGAGATNPVAEVNFGIYKGSMPLEMMTASYRHLVVTQRLSDGSIFGKDREDYVGDLPRKEPSEFVPVRRP